MFLLLAIVQSRLFRREINALDLGLGGNMQMSNLLSSGNQYQLQGPPLGGNADRTRLDSVSSSDESNSQSSSTRRSSFRLKCKFIPFLENIKVNRLIKDSNVLLIPDGNGWDWEVVSTILRVKINAIGDYNFLSKLCVLKTVKFNKEDG